MADSIAMPQALFRLPCRQAQDTFNGGPGPKDSSSPNSFGSRVQTTFRV